MTDKRNQRDNNKLTRQVTQEDFLIGLLGQMARRRIRQVTSLQNCMQLGFNPEDVALALEKMSLDEKFQHQKHDNLPTITEHLTAINPHITEDLICEAIIYQGIKHNLTISSMFKFMDDLRMNETSMQNAMDSIPSAISVLTK